MAKYLLCKMTVCAFREGETIQLTNDKSEKYHYFEIPPSPNDIIKAGNYYYKVLFTETEAHTNRAFTVMKGAVLFVQELGDSNKYFDYVMQFKRNTEENPMDSKILLGEILRRFADKGIAQVEGYSSFGYIRETNSTVYVTREKGKDTPVPFEKILIGIDAYKAKPSLYDEGPGKLRDEGITHVTSPVWAMLHLLEKNNFK